MADVFYRVRLTTEEGSTVDAGDLAATGERCAFRYAPAFGSDAKRFPLDPINLPPEKREHNANRILFGVFEDSLPDGWGRTLIARRFNLSHAQQSPHLLLQYLDHKSIGALDYDMLEGAQQHGPDHEESIDTVGELATAARDFENGELRDDLLLQRLFNSAGSSGGAHPKVTVSGDDGRLKLVKFRSIIDRYDVVGLEASCLELARMAGMQVPDFSVLEAGGSKMLCLDRFDRSEHGKRHMISMQSLLNLSGFYHASYVQMADLLRAVSASPAADVQALFRQMIFNALIGNTDDHLKNFSLYFRDGFSLTPAYDLLPDVNQRSIHTLAFLHNDVGPRRSEAIDSLAPRFKLSPVTAGEIIDEVVESVAGNWLRVCTRFEVPAAERDHFFGYIERQQAKLSK